MFSLPIQRHNTEVHTDSDNEDKEVGLQVNQNCSHKICLYEGKEEIKQNEIVGYWPEQHWDTWYCIMEKEVIESLSSPLGVKLFANDLKFQCVTLKL